MSFENFANTEKTEKCISMEFSKFHSNNVNNEGKYAWKELNVLKKQLKCCEIKIIQN